MTQQHRIIQDGMVRRVNRRIGVLRMRKGDQRIAGVTESYSQPRQRQVEGAFLRFEGGAGWTEAEFSGSAVSINERVEGTRIVTGRVFELRFSNHPGRVESPHADGKLEEA